MVGVLVARTGWWGEVWEPGNRPAGGEMRSDVTKEVGGWGENGAETVLMHGGGIIQKHSLDHWGGDWLDPQFLSYPEP